MMCCHGRGGGGLLPDFETEAHRDSLSTFVRVPFLGWAGLVSPVQEDIELP
jgi:hypothetical protein